MEKEALSKDISSEKQKSRGWMIGGIIGLVVGVLFNLNGNLLIERSSYTFNYSFLPIIEGVVIGILFGHLIQKNMIKPLVNSILIGVLGSMFSMYVIFNAEGDGLYSGSYTMGMVLFKKLVLYPLNEEYLHSFFVIISFVVIVLKWLILGMVIGFLLTKIKK